MNTSIKNNWRWILLLAGSLLFLYKSSYAQSLPAPADLATSSQQELFRAIKALEKTELSDVATADLIAIDSALLMPNIPYRNRFFLLAGWLGRLEALRAVPYEYRRQVRASNDYDMAMIRAGDPGRINRLRGLLRDLEVDDNFIYQLGPKLLYTRHREVIDFALDEILLDKRNCEVADAHSNGQINCAYRLLEMVAPLIQGFPLKVGVSGDLATDDYPAALETARAWILANRADYTIITETY